MGTITEREKQILTTFAMLMPELSDSDKSYLIGLGEGLAIRVRQEREQIWQASGKQVGNKAAV